MNNEVMIESTDRANGAPVVTCDWPDLTRTAVAVDRYDAARAAYIAGGSFDAMARACRAVREAFAADTADRNQRDTALMIAPRDPWLRELLGRWRASVPACARNGRDHEHA